MTDVKGNGIISSFTEHEDMVRAMILGPTSLIDTITLVSDRMANTIKCGGRIFFMGNGGSAADAQHFAAELVGRFEKERKAVSAISLSTDTSVITSLANDYGYEYIFSRQLEAHCDAKDVVVGISTSGNSENILRGLLMARNMGSYTIGMTGKTGGKIKDAVDSLLNVPSEDTARIQEGHVLLGHILCGKIEDEMTKKLE